MRGGSVSDHTISKSAFSPRPRVDCGLRLRNIRALCALRRRTSADELAERRWRRRCRGGGGEVEMRAQCVGQRVTEETVARGAGAEQLQQRWCEVERRNIRQSEAVGVGQGRILIAVQPGLVLTGSARQLLRVKLAAHHFQLPWAGNTVSACRLCRIGQ